MADTATTLSGMPTITTGDLATAPTWFERLVRNPLDAGEAVHHSPEPSEFKTQISSGERCWDDPALTLSSCEDATTQQFELMSLGLTGAISHA